MICLCLGNSYKPSDPKVYLWFSIKAGIQKTWSKKQHVVGWKDPGTDPKIMEGAAQQPRTNQGASHWNPISSFFYLIIFRQIIVSDCVDNFPMNYVYVSSKYLKSLSVISWIFCGTSPFQHVAIFWDLIMIVMFCLDTQMVSMYINNLVLFYSMYFYCQLRKTPQYSLSLHWDPTLFVCRGRIFYRTFDVKSFFFKLMTGATYLSTLFADLEIRDSVPLSLVVR